MITEVKARERPLQIKYHKNFLEEPQSQSEQEKGEVIKSVGQSMVLITPRL